MPTAITPLQRRARADQWLKKGIIDLLPFNRVYQQIVNLGVGYRRVEMLRRWHDLEGFAKQIVEIEDRFFDKPIPGVRHLYAEGDIGDIFRYRSNSILRHKDTGEEIEEPFTILSDRRLTFEEILEDVKDFIKRYPYLDNYEIVETHITEATMRRP